MDHAIEILSSEWIATSLSSIAFILFILYIGKISSEKNRIKFIKIIALIMILFTVTNHVTHLINGTWTLDKQLPVHCRQRKQKNQGVLLWDPRWNNVYTNTFNL